MKSTNAREKSARKSARGDPFRRGADPRRGRGPDRGAPNAGRPPDEWKAQLRGLVGRADVLAHVEAVLAAGPGHDHPEFWRALDYATDHGYGRATQAVDLTAKTGPMPSGIVILPAPVPIPSPDDRGCVVIEGDGTADTLRRPTGEVRRDSEREAAERQLGDLLRKARELRGFHGN